MKSFKLNLTSTTLVPAIVGAGLAVGGSMAFSSTGHAAGNSDLLPVAKARTGSVQLAVCGPCGGKRRGCGGCNPCGAKKRGRGACNPCSAKKRGCGACNPCAAKARCGGCNPCGAKKRACNPCNPCAAKNPCGGCNPCNPCGGNTPFVEIKDSEALAAYNCLKGELATAYAKAGVKTISGYQNWPLFNKAPYIADTHGGGRLVNNYSNKVGAKAYGRYEKIGKAPVGTVLMKDSFVAKPDGKLAIGPGFIMEKMKSSFSKATMNWKYSMILPNGSLFGVTGGKNSKGMTFCHECHGAAEDEDALRFLPGDYRN